MQLTLAGEYAIRTMVYVAERQTLEVIKISDVAEDSKIPDKFLRKIIPLLCSAGLLKTRRGIGGGITLAQPANTITPLQIIQAVEGDIALNRCLIDKTFCTSTRWCTVHTLWCDALKTLREILSSKSLEQLVAENVSKRNKQRSNK